MFYTLKRCLCRKTTIRALSTGEISTALRPFYFTVHPDLFGQYPMQRTVNENSLKHLSSILENLQQKRPFCPATLLFYLRSKDEEEVKAGKFTMVKIEINDQDIRKTILSILQTCNLPTTSLDKIKDKHVQDKQKQHLKSDFISKWTKSQDKGDKINFSHLEDDFYYTSIIMKQKINAEPDTFKAYLDKHVNEAHIKLEACRPIRAEVKKLERVLLEKLGLKNITWDCGWNITHYRGCLLSFNALIEHHPQPMGALKNRVLVFANNTGISVDGNIMLNSGEVRHNWLDLIKNINKHDQVLLRLPDFEKAVSQVLLDIKVGRRKFMPKVMVGQYECQLRQLVTKLSDYQGSKKYPKSWPQSLSTYEIVIEAEAGPLMLSPTGQFIVPSSCPGFLLVNFITEHLDEAKKRLDHYNNIKHIEREFHERVIKELNLAALNKDDSITPDLMIQCCERLLLHKSVLSPMLNGILLWVTHYYSVMNDGVLCIPWDWKL